MKRNESVEKVVARIYRDRLKRTGKLPDGKEVREMEIKTMKAAETAERTAKR